MEVLCYKILKELSILIQVLIIGSFHCCPSSFWAAFDEIEVPLLKMQDGVLFCYAPPFDCPRKVPFCIISDNGEMCSEVIDFKYREKLHQEENSIVEDHELLLKFVQMQLSDLSLQKGKSPSNSEERALLTGCGTSDRFGTPEGVLEAFLKDNFAVPFLKGESGCWEFYVRYTGSSSSGYIPSRQKKG